MVKHKDARNRILLSGEIRPLFGNHKFFSLFNPSVHQLTKAVLLHPTLRSYCRKARPVLLAILHSKNLVLTGMAGRLKTQVGCIPNLALCEVVQQIELAEQLVKRI